MNFPNRDDLHDASVCPVGQCTCGQTASQCPVHRSISEANTRQVGGAHYRERAVQPWDYIVANKLGFLEGNIIKYVTRYEAKGGVADLRKAQHYLEKLIEVASRDA